MLEREETEKDAKLRKVEEELQRVKEKAAAMEKGATDMIETARLDAEAMRARIATLEHLSKTMAEQKEAADTTVEEAMEKSEKSKKVLEDLRAANKNLRAKNSQLSKQAAQPAAASVAGPSNALVGSDPANARIQELEAALAEAKEKHKAFVSKLNTELSRRAKLLETNTIHLEAKTRENVALLQQIAALEAEQVAQFDAEMAAAEVPDPLIDAEPQFSA
jgi:predicted Zn-ribbon and HTH transcriptional regulator